MSRLTYKDTKVSGGYNAVDTDEYACVVKLGKLEDLEEQIGCPLECIVAVFRAMKQNCIYCDICRGIYELHNFRLDYVDVADNEDMGHFTRTEYHYVLDDDCLIYVEDYKKTWWLKEDKSE